MDSSAGFIIYKSTLSIDRDEYMQVVLFILLIIAFCYALALVLFNSGELAINLLFIHVPAMNAGLLLIITLGLGILIGLLMGIQLFRVFPKVWEIKKLKKYNSELRQHNKELSQKLNTQAADIKALFPKEKV